MKDLARSSRFLPTLAMASLLGLSACKPAATDAPLGDAQRPPLMTVSVREIQAEEMPREIRVTGQTLPNRVVSLKAQTPGQVQATPVVEGARVEAGTVLVSLAPEDRAARLTQAQALLEQTRLEYEAAQRLTQRSLAPESSLAQARAAFRQAEQQVEAAQLDMAKTEISAPIGGVLEARSVEVGDYVGIGDPIAELIEIDPILLTGQIPEALIHLVHVGETAHASLPNGRTVDGKIRFVARTAENATRTFRVEVEVPNPEADIPAGQTADIAIETERVMAHRISIALVSIADDGRFGVKYVDDENRVRFLEADLVRSSPDAIWVTGLPNTLRLITTGQGFTKEGDLVEPKAETTELRP